LTLKCFGTGTPSSGNFFERTSTSPKR